MSVVRVVRRFRGPERSGNGGYVAGLVGTALAGEIGPDVVPKVTLRMPPPLEKDLELAADAEGARLMDGDSLVAQAVPVDGDFLADPTTDLEVRPSVLGQLTACIDARPRAGEECVVLGRYLGEDGRKTSTASSVYDADGRVLARARHTWIMVDPAAFN